VEIRISTLERVPAEIRAEIRQNVFQALETKLPAAFPGKTLDVADDNGVIRIHGDLSLN